eukprot:4689-Heterococcus_DN1.PRE.6
MTAAAATAAVCTAAAASAVLQISALTQSVIALKIALNSGAMQHSQGSTQMCKFGNEADHQ